MKYDPKVHHRRSIRLSGYDYSSEGMYYVTLRTQGAVCVFGDIVRNEMRLSALGEIAKACWEEIPEHSQGVNLDEYVVMPNHLHGIIVIETPVGAIHESPIPEKGVPAPTTATPIPTKGLPSLGTIPPIPGNAPPWRMTILQRRKMLLPKIIGRFKMNSAKRINELRGTQGGAFWQRGYYEHIIRDGNDLDRIREYILENPASWAIDENFPENIRMDPLHRGMRDFSPLD